MRAVVRSFAAALVFCLFVGPAAAHDDPADLPPPPRAAPSPAPWVVVGGVLTASLGIATIFGAQGFAVATTALAGAPPDVVGTVAIPVVGPFMMASKTGVPDAFLPVAIAIFGVQALSLVAISAGAATATVGMVYAGYGSADE